MWTVVTPRQAALAALEGRFPEERAADQATHPLAGFQADALARVEAALGRWGGAVLADSVGLGKSYVALALVERALGRSERVVVVTPAALRRDWTPRLARVAAGARVARAIGVRVAATDPAGGVLAWLSHTRLSRGSHRPERLLPLDLLVVDEAHAFRNPATRRYRALAELARGARVLLVTATPVNNSARDLHALLRLFAAGDAFVELGVPDLEGAFEAVERGESARIRPLLDGVVIRRTRSEVVERGQGAPAGGGEAPAPRFPRQEPPRPVRYSLDASRPGLFETVADALESLTLAPYRLRDFGDATRSAAAAPPDLIRLMLLKRLESGLPAMLTSVRRLFRFYGAFENALREGLLLSPSEHRSLYGSGADGDSVQLVLGGVALRAAPETLRLEPLAAAAAADSAALDGLMAALRSAEAAGDPKLRELRRLLDGPLWRQKVLIFTEYRDTARALWRALAGRGRVGLIDGAGAALGRAAARRRQVIERFAPDANGATAHERDRVDVLIATDVLAEGMNLQDARVVVSYDLPWNPVRLIQRIGRIDRLGSPHETVESWHFLPDRELEPMLRLMERLRRKLETIGVTVGGEAGLLDAVAGRRGTALMAKRLAAGDPAALGPTAGSAPASPATRQRLLEAWRAAEKESVHAAPPPLIAEFPAGDLRILALEGHAGASTTVARFAVAVVALRRAGRTRRLLVRLPADPICATSARVCLGSSQVEGQLELARYATIDDTAVDELLLAALRGPAAESGTLSAEARRAAAAAVDVANAYVAAEERSRASSTPLDLRSPSARAARRLRDALAAVPGGPEEPLCTRADALLRRLASAPAAGVEQTIEAALRRSEGDRSANDAESLIGALQTALADALPEAARSAAEQDEWTPVAILSVLLA